MANDLSLEISGSSEKAVSALDRMINKLSEYQSKLISTIPKMNQFNNILKNIPSGSGNRYKELANGINAVSSALKKFDNKTPLQTLKNELEMIKRSSSGLDITAGKLNNIANSINNTGSASKLSAEIAKSQSQIEISNARVQSALAKSAYDTENYALKTQKLAMAKEKLAESERKATENAKWDEEAQKSLKDAVARGVSEYQKQFENTDKYTGESSGINYSRVSASPVKWTDEQLQNQAQVDALYRTSFPEFDNSKIRDALRETQEFINNLTPSMENMSTTAQNRFDGMAEKLKSVNMELERQKQLNKNLTEDYATLSKSFSPDILAKDGFKEKIESSKQHIESLTAKSDMLKKSMEKLTNPTKQASNAIENAGKSSNKASKEFSTFDRVIRNVKTYLLVGAVNKISEAFSGALQNAMNFTENMNLFNISMGENVLKAGEFVDKMSSVFGMDSSNLVKTMGNFYQISHSMGVSSKNAYVLSENFTKLANDLSSFYNIPVNDAAIKLQAGLVGETEPLRRLGIIITENALKQTAANLGIEKSVRDMSEAEKMHLRYITVLNQTKNIQGDFARTINEPAQAIRILQEQMSQLGRAIGSIFMPILGAVLPYIIAFARALTTVIGVFAKFLGYKAPEYRNFSVAASGANDLANSANNVGTNLGKAAKQAKELKKQVMSFDELNILTKPTESTPSGGSGGSGGVGGDFAVPDLTGYDNLMDSVNTRIDEIYNNIMETFSRIGEALQPTIQAFERLGAELDRLKGFAWEGLLDFYNSFLVPVGNWVFSEGLPRFIDALTNGLASVDWEKITDSLHNLWTALTPYAIAVGEGLLWFWEKVLVPIGSWTLNNAVPTFLNLLSGALKILTPIIEAQKSAFEWLWTKFLFPIATWTGGVICSVLNEFAKVLESIGNWMSQHTELIENLIIIIGSFAIAWGLVTLALNAWNIAVGIWNAVGSVGAIVTTAFGVAVQFLTSPITLVVLAIGALIAIVILCIKYWDDIKTVAISCWESIVNAFNVAIEWFKSNWQGLLLLLVNPFAGAFKLIYDNCEGFRNFVDNLVSNIGKLFSDLWQNISNAALGCWQAIIGVWDVVSEWFNSNIIEPVSRFFTDLWNNIKTSAANCWNRVVTVWNVVSDWFDKNIISPIKNLFSGLWEKIQNIFKSTSSWFGNIFTNAYNAVKSAFSGVANFFSGIWQNIKSTFTNIGSTIGNAIGGAFKTVVNSIINFAQNTINGFIQAINSAISLINMIPGVNVGKVRELSIPRLAKGGLVTDSIIANIGEGKDSEAVLPLNDDVFSKLAEGINKNNADNTQIISEESLYRAFLKALQDAPEKTATFIATLNNKVIAKEVLKEQQNQSRRFSPVAL